MKKTLPLIIGFVAGVFAFGELYVKASGYRLVFDHLRDFAQILASVAFVLGGINLVQVNYPKIRRREQDWVFKVVMLVSAVIMGVAGIRWHAIGGERSSGQLAVGGTPVAAATTATVRFDSADKDALVVVDGVVRRAWHSGDPRKLGEPPGDTPLQLELPPGEHLLIVRMPVAGYAEWTRRIVVGASEPRTPERALYQRWTAGHPSLAPVMATYVGLGQVATVKSDLVMFWGAQSPQLGRVFTWLYDHVFFPCNATMFALLAFFIASAAFRAFRARSTESALLLGAAILVMIGLVPLGAYVSSAFPEIQQWIMAVMNTTGRRAIMMGAALGAIATGLRVILGIERSHLGHE